MFVKSRFVLFTIVLLVLGLTACAGAFGGNELEPVTAATVNTSLQYVDIGVTGPAYDVSFVVPNEWVGKFVIRNIGNVLVFNHTTDTGQSKPLFYIEALSDTQYWQASGGYPTSQTNIINLGDTYFVYHLPVDTFHSGLAEDEFQALAAAVPDIVASFSAQLAR